jgi:hypothetical protein
VDACGLHWVESQPCVHKDAREEKEKRMGENGEYTAFLAKIDEYEADLQAEFPLSSHLPTRENLRAIAKLVEHEITKCVSLSLFSLPFLHDSLQIH